MIRVDTSKLPPYAYFWIEKHGDKDWFIHRASRYKSLMSGRLFNKLQFMPDVKFTYDDGNAGLSYKGAIIGISKKDHYTMKGVQYRVLDQQKLSREFSFIDCVENLLYE